MGKNSFKTSAGSKEDYQLIAANLKGQIKIEFGSLTKFAEAKGMNRGNLSSALSGSPTPYRIRMIEHLLETGKLFNEVSETVTKELRYALSAAVYSHPDAMSERGIPYASKFFEGKPWRNTYFTEVMNGKRNTPGTKLMELCNYLNINIFTLL